MSFEIFLRETDVRFASLNTLLYSAACWSSHEVPCRFIQTNYVYKKALTSLWYNLSQGKLHSLVTLLQQLWSSDTGSTSSAFLDSEDWIGLPEGSQMFSSFSFSFFCLIVFVLIYLAADMTPAFIHAHSQRLDSAYTSPVCTTDSSNQQGCN